MKAGPGLTLQFRAGQVANLEQEPPADQAAQGAPVDRVRKMLPLFRAVDPEAADLHRRLCRGGPELAVRQRTLQVSTAGNGQADVDAARKSSVDAAEIC